MSQIPADSTLAAILVHRHQIGVEVPLSRADNIDTPFMDAARETLGGTPEGNLMFQKFRTLYHQMMLPVALRNLLPVGIMRLFCLLMIMLMLSADDSRVRCGRGIQGTVPVAPAQRGSETRRDYPGISLVVGAWICIARGVFASLLPRSNKTAVWGGQFAVRSLQSGASFRSQCERRLR